MNIKYKYLNALALPPIYATPGSACFDIHSVEQVDVSRGTTRKIKTGLSFEIPEGHVMLLFSRSGHAAKHSMRLGNCVGVIDSDYRGEVCILMHNDGEDLYRVMPQERIAQAMILPLPAVTLSRVDELSNTDRGSGGFGSTG